MNDLYTKNNIYKMLSWLWLVGCFFVLCFYLDKNVDMYLDSDMSAELILSKQLADSGKLFFSDNWFYSTEIRFINTQLIFSQFFRIFDNWHLVRVAGSITLYVIFLICYYFFCNCLDISKAFPITAGILLLPVSEPYFYIMLFGVYYIPHVSFCFLIIGLLIKLSQNIESSLIKKVIRILLLTVSSFCAAANGLRLVLFVFIPLFCMCAIKGFMAVVSHDRQFVKSRNYYFIIYSAISLVFSIFGYGFNRLFLAKRFVYFSFGDLQLFNGHKIRNVLRAEFQALGYNYESPLIINIFAAFLAVLTVIVIIYIITKWKKLPYEHVLFAEYCSFSLLGVNLCFLLTNTTMISWYFIPAIIMIIPLVTVFLTDYGEHTVKYVLSTLLIIFTVFVGAYNYKHFNGIDFYYYRAFPSPERQVVARFLRNNGYTSGYGTVWNVGVWTELTNGQVEMWYAYELDEDMTQKWNIPEYLQSVDHICRKPEGKVFAVFDADEYDSAKSLPSEISEEVFRTNLFVVCDVIN